jgi:hypothetical protein
MQDHIGGSFEPKDLALQAVDIITLRPEVQLCYVGIRNKCFEVLECSPTRAAPDQFGSSDSGPQTGGAFSVIDLDDDNEDGSNNNSGTDETEDEDDDTGTHASSHTDNENEDDLTEISDVESDGDDLEDPAHGGQSGPRLRLREILFYDDKVAVFKARHGRL